jgi:6-pyruvoyl-tetrahydropterin synthase
MALMATTRRYSFRAVHSLDSGIHREKFHGHQYFVEISFERCLPADVDRVVEKKILRVLEGHDLARLISPATGEMTVEWIQRELDASPLGAKILGVALQETRKNRFVSARTVPQLI